MPRVALETALLTHGLPRPLNVEVALRLADIVRAAGAIPSTVGVVRGRLAAGLSEQEIRRLGSDGSAVKVSLRDLPIVAARRQSGGTTVAATLHAAATYGIHVFATGGIGGVHRTAAGAPATDVSADLHALARYPVCVVCAGAKAILDLPATLQALETLGVTVLGYRTSDFPAFYSASSGLQVDARVDSPDEVASIILERRRLQLPGGVLVAAPVPSGQEVPRQEIEPLIARAVEEARAEGLQSAEVTPFLLRRVRALTEDRALATNVALLENNAGIAAEIALALDRLVRPRPVSL